MKPSVWFAGVTTAVLLAAVTQAATPTPPTGKIPRAAADVRGKPGYPGPQGESWDSIKRLPDFGGVWSAPLPGTTGVRSPPAGQPPLTAPYKAKLDAYNAAKAKGENTQTENANCVPFAYPRSMGIYPIEFLMTPGKVTVVMETDSQMQRIFTDGRPVNEDPDLSFQGYAVGHWEGDTLVSEVRGLVPAPQMEIVPGAGHSDKLKIFQRARLVSPNVLEVQWTYDDVEALTQPWVVTRLYERHRDWDIQEYNCAQNNHDAADEKGRPTMRLD
jgi:hypothetical protein